MRSCNAGTEHGKHGAASSLPCYERRRLNIPVPHPFARAIRFAPELPISARVRDITAAIEKHQVVIVAGDTGSGKTTQLPKLCLAMGRNRIGVTQPRRIAATSVAARIASELGVELGREVGYQVRFADRTSALTRVKLMTDGILLAELQSDPLLSGYDTIILDEAHERTLNIDFLLGTLKTILARRSELRLIVSSATLAFERFSEFFGGAPVVQVSGRTYPVTVVHRPPENDATLSENVAEVVEEITERDARGDILVFLPGEREIKECAAVLHTHGLPHTAILPLYGRLPQAEQARIFERMPQRRIILATNVAETSLTIPGIVYVIDSGIARINRYEPRSGVTRLLIEPISRASADQRKGRAGRTQKGVCFRLYERNDFNARPAYTDPEVLRVGLASAILQMKVRGLGEISAFPFLDPPPKRAADEGHRVLEELGALTSDRALTDLGHKLARLPVDPRIGRMILAAEESRALREVLIIAAALGLQDPRERPRGAERQAENAHERFRDEESDFTSLLKLWEFWDAHSKGPEKQLRRVCRDHFLSHARLREWGDVHQQLTRVARDLGLDPDAQHAPKSDAIHRAVLTGLLSRVGTWHPEQRTYLGARQTRFQLHPSSALAKKKAPPWIVAAELTETSQLFARTAARIDPAWLESLGGAACKRTHGDPNWAKSSAQVMCKEQVTLYGLPIVRDRKAHFGPIDPVTSRRLFIVHALVRGEYAPKVTAPFMLHNRALFEQVKQLRDRARKSDMLADDHSIALFFEKRVPDDVFCGQTFEAWRARAEADDPRVLFLSLGDVLVDEEELSIESFPDSLIVSGVPLALSYRFDPGDDLDGISVTIPLARLLDLDPEVLEWTIPGWHREKITQLLESIPRVEPRAIAAELRPFEGAMLDTVARAAGVLRRELRVDDLSPHLRFHFRVVEGTRPVGEGRDLAALQDRFAMRARDTRSVT
jgi:ATP-dependent helicase HrpA